MLKIAICDDVRAETAYLSSLARRWAAARDVSLVVSEYESAESFLFTRGESDPPDILLLDIQMKGMDGVELARRIRGDDDVAQIIFVTGFRDYIAEGYDVAALHYLMKPVAEEKLFEVLDRAAERLKRAARTLLVQTSGALLRLPVDDIVYVEAFAHNVVINTRTTPIETRTGIGELEQTLGNAVVRCHRSYLAGLKYISRITKSDVIMDDGRAVPLSRRLYTRVNLAFIQYHRGAR